MSKKQHVTIHLPTVEKKLVTVPVSDLKGYPGNPRHNNKSAKIVAKSIQEYGYINPIVVNEDLVILAGNTRHKALKYLGIQEVEVLMVSGLTEEQEKGFVIADNRVGEYSTWNMSAVSRMADGMKDNALMEDLGIRSVEKMKDELEALINSWVTNYLD